MIKLLKDVGGSESMTKRFEALRLDDYFIKNGLLVNRWFVLGQRTDTLNWETLVDFELKEDAIDWVKQYRNRIDKNIICYDINGYSMECE